MLKYKNKLLAILLSALLVVISGCGDLEALREQNQKDKIKREDLNIFHSKPLSTLTCKTIDRQYERCSEYRMYNRIEYCQAKYMPVLMRCYGSKSN